MIGLARSPTRPTAPAGRHEDTDAFIASLWRATDATLAEDEQRHREGRVDRTRHRMRLTDDLPSRYDRPSGRRDDATRATRDPNQILLGANEVVVAETLRAAGQPLTRGEVEARSGLTFAQVRRSLGHLRDAGRVAMSGWGGRHRPGQLRPVAAVRPHPGADAIAQRKRRYNQVRAGRYGTDEEPRRLASQGW